MSKRSGGHLFAFFAKSDSLDTDLEDGSVQRVRLPWALRRIAPYMGAIGAIALGGMLLITIYFTWLDWQWIIFLAGVLVAAVLALASRSVHAEWLIARRAAQLALLRQKLASEIRRRTRAEQGLAGVEKNITYLHESLPAMLAYIDDQQQLKYHNRAFVHGLGKTVSGINGRHLRDVVGNIVYGDLESDLSRAFGGSLTHREHTHVTSTDESFQLLTQCLPQFNDRHEVVGVFLLSTDITEPANSVVPALPVPTAETPDAETRKLLADAIAEAEAEAGRNDEIGRLRSALERNEFCLFFQTIEPVAANSVAVPFREILLRLKAEEENMMPPGSFLPVAEEHGMLPDLDRWVVRHVLGWMRVEATRQQALYSINIAAQTLSDPEFPTFVKKALRDFGLPGSLLCFELKETDVQHRLADTNRFIGQLGTEGCKQALCGFSGSQASFDLLRQVPVNFLKIDGSLILNLRRSAVDLARVKAIHRVAQAIGISTVAECVENNKTLAQLRLIGVDFAQGFGISRPRDLREISSNETTAESAAHAGNTAIAGD
jgi:EAL domain-containing protein (putative c-di-GMP-specific phosphodiesterase class I)/PAS domain-containing protein